MEPISQTFRRQNIQTTKKMINKNSKTSSITKVGSSSQHFSDSNVLSVHLERFVNYLQFSKNASPKTIENYSLWINRFIEYMGDIEADEVKSIHVQDFRMFLSKQGLSTKTVNYHVVGLRSFFKFLLRNDIDTIAPDKLDLAKIPPRQLCYLNEDEIEKILGAPL